VLRFCGAPKSYEKGLQIMQTIIGKEEEFVCHNECVGRLLEGRWSLRGLKDTMSFYDSKRKPRLLRNNSIRPVFLLPHFEV
jgi:hypothetical protein